MSLVHRVSPRLLRIPSALLFIASFLVTLLTLADGARATDPLTIGSQLEPTGLDPTITASSATAQVLFPAVYEGLVRLEENGVVKPLLATSWDVSTDGMTYTFHLRQGVRFHDGAPFNAEAVRFSLERIIAADSINPQKPELTALDHVETPDAETAILRLNRPYSRLVQVLGWGAMVMISPASAAGNALAPVGTGPFRFFDWKRGDSIVLVRNPTYWGRPARLERAVYKFIADPNAALAALKAGDVNAFDAYPAPENIAALQADPRFKVDTGLSQAKTIMALNNARPPFDNLLVRQALSYAVDRRAVIDGAMFGHGEPIGSHFPPQEPGYVDLTGRYPHDPAKARALLASAGYPHGFTVSLKLPPLPYARRSGEIVAAQLSEVGVHVDLVNLEWMSWLEQVYLQHDFDMSIVAHIEPMDYTIYGRSDYYFGYNSPDLQSLLHRLDAATEADDRRSLLKDIQTKIAEDAVNVFLFEMPVFVVRDARVSALSHLTPAQLVDLAGTSIEAGDGTADTATGNRAYRGLLATISVLAIALLSGALWRAGPAYLLGRLGLLAGVLVAASLLIFVVLQIAPGDPARYMLGMDAMPDSVAALRHRMGLEGGVVQRYLRWLGGLLQGDFGISYTYGVPVADLIGERLRVSLPLAIYALLLSFGLAFLIGLQSALRRGSWIDGTLSAVSQLGLAIPEFWLGLVLVLVFAVHLHWTSAGGFPGWQGGFLSAVRGLTLPAIALALPQAAILGRVLRGELIDALGEDYVRAARAKGMSERQALFRHALPNALVPVFTLLGMQAAFLLAGSIIVENVFSLPGLGRLVFQAVTQRDLIVVQAVVLVLVAAVVSVTALADLACATLDPRWRGRRER
jgi:ABC-type transport system substrate-binding protein/ABC-type dipeptide/oligopeptide/nickel transport system permease component